jgi:Na+/proline symporter
MEKYQTFEVTADPWTVFAFLFYIVLMIVIGLYSARFSSGGIGEFFIGGRKMKSFVVALSAVVSGRSAWLVLGVTGMAYIQGLSAIWAIVGYTLVELFMFLYGAKRLRRYTERLDNVTIPAFIFSALAVIIISLLTDAPAGVQTEMEMMKPRYKRKMSTLRNSR